MEGAPGERRLATQNDPPEVARRGSPWRRRLYHQEPALWVTGWNLGEYGCREWSCGGLEPNQGTPDGRGDGGSSGDRRSQRGRKVDAAEHLAGELDAAVVHCDDFYRDMSDVDRRLLTPEAGVLHYFDWERLLDEAVRPLRLLRRATFRCFDWSAGSGLTGPVSLDPKPVLIVEGVYAARLELSDVTDLRVLVVAPDDDRRLRRRARRDPHEWELRWDAAERHYFTVICPPESFDVIFAAK